MASGLPLQPADGVKPLPVWRRLARVRGAWLRGRAPERLAWSAFVFVTGLVTIASVGVIALATDAPFLFPSLGPTAFLLFFSPTTAAASPRNAIYGHAIGIISGYAALWLCGLADDPAATVQGVNGARVLAAGLSMAFTGGLMVLTRAPHPPAGATTLLVSLGTIRRLTHLPVIMLAVAVLVMEAMVINRLAGVPYPRWRAAAPPEDAASTGDATGRANP